MALSAKLELRQTQSLVITPQLQQAIRLLQYSNIELQAFLEREIEQNPFVEWDESAGPDGEPGASGAREPDMASTASPDPATAEQPDYPQSDDPRSAVADGEPFETSADFIGAAHEGLSMRKIGRAHV